MARKLYTVDDKGALQFKIGHRAWGVDVPAYIYDIWMPLLGVRAIGVYATYCRLGHDRKIWGQGRRELAAAMRISDNTLAETNRTLVECGFISIETPQGHQRTMHWTTKITILEPPRVVSTALLEKYVLGQDPTRYKTLVPWLVDEEASNRYPAITEMSNRQIAITPSGVQSLYSDAKNDPSDLNDPIHKNLSARKNLADPPNPYLSHIPAADGDVGDRSGEQTVVETPKGESVVPGQENWTAFEKWLLTSLRKTSLTEQQRGYFNQIGFYVPEGSTEALERLSVNEAWDKWPSFQRYVAEKIVPAVKTKNMFNIRGFNNWLNSPETWKFYMAWPEREDDPTAAGGAGYEEDGSLVSMPDGVQIWVPSTMTPDEAYQEYLRSQNE